MSEVKGSQGLVPADAPGEGPSRLFQLPGTPGFRPWAAGRLPPVSASVSTGLLLCVPVSPLLCLIRTLSLGLGPSPSRRALSQTLHSITAAESLFSRRSYLWTPGIRTWMSVSGDITQPTAPCSGAVLTFSRSPCSARDPSRGHSRGHQVPRPPSVPPPPPRPAISRVPGVDTKAGKAGRRACRRAIGQSPHTCVGPPSAPRGISVRR